MSRTPDGPVHATMQGMLLHSVTTYAAHPEVVEAGVIKAIRNAVLVVIAIVFFIGGFLGFLLGKAFGRRTRN